MATRLAHLLDHADDRDAILVLDDLERACLGECLRACVVNREHEILKDGIILERLSLIHI